MNVSNENSKVVLAASRYEYIHYEFIWKKKIMYSMYLNQWALILFSFLLQNFLLIISNLFYAI